MNEFWKRWLALIILLIGLCSFFYFDLGRYLTFTALKQHREMLLAWTNENYFLAVFIFMFIYIIAVAISIPGATFFTIISGFLFGLILGTIYVVISATLGSLIIFLAVRIALEPLLIKKANKWIDKMRNGFQSGAIQYLLILRLIPIFPFWMVNIAAALVGVKTSIFIATTFVGIIPGSFVYVLLGNGLGHLFDENKTPNLRVIFEPQIFISLLGLALLSFLPSLYKLLKRYS